MNYSSRLKSIRQHSGCPVRILNRPPLEILAELRAIEQEILQGIEELDGMLR